jgi:predicted transcriptional regulator
MTISARLPTTTPAQPDGGGSDDWGALELLEADFDDACGGAGADWVEAAPFRAHVRQLISAYGLAWRTVAVLAEIPPAVVAQLLRGRHGRPLTRIHPLVARRLFQLTGAVVDDARSRLTPARDARILLRLLADRGWDISELAARTGVPAAELQSIVDGRRSRCSQLTAATVKAAAQALHPVAAPRQPGGSPPGGAGLVRAA